MQQNIFEKPIFTQNLAILLTLSKVLKFVNFANKANLLIISKNRVFTYQLVQLNFFIYGRTDPPKIIKNRLNFAHSDICEKSGFLSKSRDFKLLYTVYFIYFNNRHVPRKPRGFKNNKILFTKHGFSTYIRAPP